MHNRNYQVVVPPIRIAILHVLHHTAGYGLCIYASNILDPKRSAEQIAGIRDVWTCVKGILKADHADDTCAFDSIDDGELRALRHRQESF